MSASSITLAAVLPDGPQEKANSTENETYHNKVLKAWTGQLLTEHKHQQQSKRNILYFTGLKSHFRLKFCEVVHYGNVY